VITMFQTDHAVLDAEEFSEVRSQHDQMRMATLNALIKRLRSIPEDSKEFSRLFAHSLSVLEVDDATLARMFRVSRPTIGRWARGDSAPHPIGRKPVFDQLINLARLKLKYYTAEPRAV
jgi:hypothetical protein